MKAERHSASGTARRWLLRAALLRGDAAVQAWSKWRNAFDLERADPASQQLFPLLAHNLVIHGISDPWRGKLKGHYRRAWYRQQLALAEVERAVKALQEIGAHATPIGDLALAAYYDDIALRPLNQPALLISLDDLVPAAEQLQRIGYDRDPHFPVALQPLHLVVRHFYDFRRDAARLRLYWRPWASHHGCERDRATPRIVATRNQSSIALLHPADHLLHLAARYGGTPYESCILLADMFSIVRAEEEKLNWERVLRGAEVSHLLPALSEMLLLLHEAVDLYLAPAVEETARITSSVTAGQLWQTAWQPQSMKRLLALWQTNRGLRQSGNVSLDFPRYLQHFWGLPSRSHLPRYLLFRSLRLE